MHQCLLAAHRDWQATEGEEVSNDQTLEDKVRRQQSTGGRALRQLRTLTNVRGHKVLLVELPGMNRPTYWKWSSGHGDEALFEQTDPPL
jgi:hypothetical protein